MNADVLVQGAGGHCDLMRRKLKRSIHTSLFRAQFTYIGDLEMSKMSRGLMLIPPVETFRFVMSGGTTSSKKQRRLNARAEWKASSFLLWTVNDTQRKIGETWTPWEEPDSGGAPGWGNKTFPVARVPLGQLMHFTLSPFARGGVTWMDATTKLKVRKGLKLDKWSFIW